MKTVDEVCVSFTGNIVLYCEGLLFLQELNQSIYNSSSKRMFMYATTRIWKPPSQGI